jgi:hypothetical protein
VATLEETMAAQRPRIIRQWLDVMLEAHAPETARFFEVERDPFANPVGAIVRGAAEALYDRLCQPTAAAACPALERLMRLRAVEESRPSRAVGFLRELKRLLRAELAAGRDAPAVGADRLALEDRIDALTMEAVDLFVAAREELAALRVAESRRGTEKLLERLRREAGLREPP